MSIKFTCDDKQTLVAYLYGEIDHADATGRRRASRRVRSVRGGSDGARRRAIGAWPVGAARRGARLHDRQEVASCPPAAVLRPARWWTTVPAWAQAAAAILVVAAGAAIANVQVKSGPEGFSVTTGWMQPAAPAQSAPFDGAAVERRVERGAGRARAAVAQPRFARRASRSRVWRPRTQVDEATIRRVQQLIAESEQRHERELAMRFIEFTRDMNMQRRADLVNISRGMVELGRTVAAPAPDDQQRHSRLGDPTAVRNRK